MSYFRASLSNLPLEFPQNITIHTSYANGATHIALFLLSQSTLQMNLKNIDYKANIQSWITVALISVPLAISLAIVGGATPMMGLLSGAWSGILAAIFCSSRHNAFGPAGSLAGILLPITMTYGILYLPLLAIISWIFILIFGALKLTKYLSLIPWASLQWFLLGIGLIIGLEQIPAILWLDLSYSLPEVVKNLWETNLVALWLFLVTLWILYICRNYTKVPGAIVVTVLWVIIGKYTQSAGIDLYLLMNEYTDVTFKLFAWFEWKTYLEALRNGETLKVMIIAGVWVGVIALLETLISAKIAMKDTRVPYDPQREVFGLGITNIITWLVGWIPVSALVPRTSMNINSGASSKLSGWLIGLFTWIFSAFFFSNSLQFLPFAIVAGILVDIALGMINMSFYHKLRKVEKGSIIVVMLVGLISYLRDPMLGILIGTVIALLVVTKRALDSDLMANVFRDGHHIKKLPLNAYQKFQKEGDLLLIKLEGELNYLTSESHILAMKTVEKASTIILWFGYTALIDLDAQEELEHLITDRLNQGKEVYITWLREQSLHVMEQGSIYAQLKASGHIFDSKSALLEKLLG